MLSDESFIKASSLKLECKRDLIRLVYIKLHSTHIKSSYKTKDLDQVIETDNFRFTDFMIIRSEKL